MIPRKSLSISPTPYLLSLKFKDIFHIYLKRYLHKQAASTASAIRRTFILLTPHASLLTDHGSRITDSKIVR